jgi:outer membrane protein TolC
VVDSIPLNYQPDKQDLAAKLESSNTSLLSFQKQVSVSRLGLKEMKTMLLPKVNFNAGYSLAQGNNGTGSPVMNSSFGPQIGGTISIPIFQSGNASRQIKSARIELQAAEFNLEASRLLVNEQLQNALTQFENQHRLLQIEKDNAVLAKENLEISIQRLRLGQTTSLEVSLAEGSFVESLTRLINFEYNLKAAETKLKQLISKL